ncbi:MAG: zinc-dependent peptidase [Phycisphaerae bacterium]|nr:zinc-dependent peptidase [Phycisphaerae bacterium]
MYRYIIGSTILGGGLWCWLRMEKQQKRMALLREPLKPEFKAILEKNFPLYKKLPTDLQGQLQGLVNVFLAEKRFEGCGGQEITDEVRVTIAGQACLLLLNRKTRFFPKLQTILVYPSTYVGTSAQGGQSRLGESWQNGPIVLAWNSVTGGAVNMTDGQNVVIHEFAHRLDQEDGDADGAPILESRGSYTAWAQVLGAEYMQLVNKTGKHKRSVMNNYGATNPAEFFAVATETFFEKPKQMQKKHPELYEELKEYYNLDPIEWV